MCHVSAGPPRSRCTPHTLCRGSLLASGKSCTRCILASQSNCMFTSAIICSLNKQGRTLRDSVLLHTCIHSIALIVLGRPAIPRMSFLYESVLLQSRGILYYGDSLMVPSATCGSMRLMGGCVIKVCSPI